LPRSDEGEDPNKAASTKDAAKQAEPDSSQEKDTTTQQSQDPSSKNEGDAPQGNLPVALVTQTPKKPRGKKKKNKSKKKKPANSPSTPPLPPTTALSRSSSTSTLDHDPSDPSDPATMHTPPGSSPVTRALTAAEALVRLHGRALDALLPQQPSSPSDDDEEEEEVPPRLRLSRDTFNELSDAHGPGTVVHFMRVGEKGEKRTLCLPDDAADGELAYRWTVPRYAAWEKLERCVAGDGQGIWVEVEDGLGEGGDGELVPETDVAGLLECEGVKVFVVRDGDVVEIVKDGEGDGRQEERARGSMVGLLGGPDVPEGEEMTAEEWKERVHAVSVSNEREERQ
jgi:hypothetical protein